MKNLKIRNTLKNLACCILSASMLTECTASVWASESREEMRGLNESEEDMSLLDAFSFNAVDLMEFLQESGDPGDLALVSGDESEDSESGKSYIHLTDDTFDVSDFGELDDENKALAFASYAKDSGDIFRSILSEDCDNLEKLKTVVRSKFILEGLDSRFLACERMRRGALARFCPEGSDLSYWYSRLSQLIQADRKFFAGADSDQLLEFRVFFMRETFLRAVYVSVCGDFAPDDLTKQRVYLINQHLLTFANKNPGIFSPDDVKKVYEKIGRLLKAKGSGFAECFLRHVYPERYKRRMTVCREPGALGSEIDLRLMDCMKESKSILMAAYAKLKEADQLLSAGQYPLAFGCVGESRRLMEAFQTSYNRVLPYSVSSRCILEEYCSVSARWNKIKNTLDKQIMIGRKFDKVKKFMNDYINLFCLDAEDKDIDWFVNLGDMVRRIPLRAEFDEDEIKSMGHVMELLSELREGIRHDYSEFLLNTERVQNMLRSIGFCEDNIKRLMDRAQEQMRINEQKAADAERRKALKKERDERQEYLRQKKEQESLKELERIVRDKARRDAATASAHESEPQEYQVTYINDEIKAESQKFLRNNKDAEELWKKWFNEVRVTGSSTMNYLPNMKSQRRAFLRFRRGLIQLAPNDVIYEARLDTSGEQAGMRIVYYIEKGTHKVVILYVGLPFGVVHKNVVSVLVEYANFPEASLDDCEASSDSESATESAASAAAASKSSSKSSKSHRECGDDDDDDDDSDSESDSERSSAKRRNKKSKRSKRRSKDHKGGHKR